MNRLMTDVERTTAASPSQPRSSMEPWSAERQPCPHCGEPCGPGVKPTHVCADRDPWTREEKDRMRALLRRWSPSITFVPSSEEFARRFGHRSQRT